MDGQSGLPEVKTAGQNRRISVKFPQAPEAENMSLNETQCV